VQGYRSTPAHPRLLLHRKAGQAEVMGDSSLRPLLLHSDGERRARHGDRGPRGVAGACGQADLHCPSRPDTRLARLKSFIHHFDA
jgi:hypothetical protein